MQEFANSIFNFLSRNEGEIVGSFLGAFLAGIVAFYSVHKTNDLTQKREKKKLDVEKKKKINRYCALLHTVIVELKWHEEINPMIISQVDGIRGKSKNAGQIIIDEPSTFINIDYIRKLRDQFYEFDFANQIIPTHLQLYANRAEIINRSLKLSTIDETIKRLDEPENFDQRVDLYFDGLMEDFTEIDTILKLNINFALKEINEYPNAKVHKYYDHKINAEENS